MKALSQYDPKPVITTALAHPAKVLNVGIDIAKDIHVARVVRGTGERLKDRLAFTSKPDSLNTCITWLHSPQQVYHVKHVFVGMEPTGL